MTEIDPGANIHACVFWHECAIMICAYKHNLSNITADLVQFAVSKNNSIIPKSGGKLGELLFKAG